jgi:hypothetical protein
MVDVAVTRSRSVKAGQELEMPMPNRVTAPLQPTPAQAHGDLPPPETQRWVARRKAQVVAAVRCGRLTFEEACRRYNISPEEFISWERAIDRHGLSALRVTKLQDFRQE